MGSPGSTQSPVHTMFIPGPGLMWAQLGSVPAGARRRSMGSPGCAVRRRAGTRRGPRGQRCADEWEEVGGGMEGNHVLFLGFLETNRCNGPSFGPTGF